MCTTSSSSFESSNLLLLPTSTLTHTASAQRHALAISRQHRDSALLFKVFTRFQVLHPTLPVPVTLHSLMYEPVTSITGSRRDALETRDEEGFESNLKFACGFAVAIAVIVVANFFLNQLQIASTTSLNQATYSGFSSRAATSLYFVVCRTYCTRC